MEQPGFWDLIDREALLKKVGDPLPKIDAIAEWEGLRSELERFRDRLRNSKAGRKRFDELIDPQNTSADVWAYSAYRCWEQQQALAAQGYRSHLHRRAQAGKAAFAPGERSQP